MQQQMITMLEMQQAMNEKVHENWRDQNFEWYRAIWIEAAELLDHYGWKWWKKQEPDRAQVVLELVDIWHFGLSILLTESNSNTEIAKQVCDELRVEHQEQDFRLLLETFALETLKTKRFDVAGFVVLMGGIELSFEELFLRYVGKNVLNFFRQDHGYKDGSYVKVWNGKEDNEHLVEVLGELDSSRSDFREAVYTGLQSRYPKP